MAVPGFIFGGNTGINSPEELARARMLAEALRGPQAPAKTVGEGLAVLGQAIRGRREMNAVNQASTAGQASAQSAIARALGGAGSFPPAPAPGGAPVAPVSSGAPVAQSPGGDAIRAKLIERGLPEHVADAFVMNFQDESGLNPGINEQNPTVPGSRGGFGLYQLTGPRRREYEKFAADRGVDPADTDAQLDFLMKEGQGSEKAAFDAILAAPDTGSAAAAIVNKFLRPAESHRASRAARYLRAGGGPVQTASNDPTSGIAQALAGTPQPAPAQQAITAALGVPFDPSQPHDAAAAARAKAGATQMGVPYQAPPSPIASALNGPPQGPVPGTPAAVTPAGQRVVQQMVNPQPIGGQFQGIEPSLRPFNQGERRPNPDGSYSTEISTTQQQPDGQFVNVPSLWMGKQGSVQFNPGDERGIMSEAQRFEAQNGQTFPRFPNVQAAEQAAVAKSAAGGAGAQQVAQAAPDNLPVMAGGSADAIPKGQLPSIQQLVEAAQNPWLNDGQRAMVNMLLKQQMDAQDPANQMGLEKQRLELDALKNPKPKYDFMAGKDGSIFRANETEGSISQVYGGKPDTFRTLTAEEKVKMGLPADGAYQIGADNKISQIGGGGTTVNIDQKTEGAFEKKLAEKQAETFDAMSTEGMNAKAELGVIGELDSLLQGQGGTLTGISGLAAKYGIGGEGMGDLQATQAIINKLIPSQRQPGSGTMSDRDVDMFTRSLPSLWNQPGGNQKILNVMRGLATYKQAQGEIADQILAGEISRQEGRKMLRELPNPLAEFTNPPSAPDANKKRLKFNPATGELE